MGDLLGITGREAAAVVISAAGVYAAFLVMVRFLGARVLARMSTFDLVITLMLGAVAGRVILGDTPVLEAGVIGLATLLALEVVVGQFRTHSRVHRWLTPDPILVIRDGRLLDEGLRRAHVTVDEIAAALRQQGVRRIDEVAYGIFEPTGAMSLLRTGVEVDSHLLSGVVLPGGPARPWHRL